MFETGQLTEALLENWHVWVVTVVLVVAAVIDGIQLKVPNWITFPMIATGWIYSTVAFGWEGSVRVWDRKTEQRVLVADSHEHGCSIALRPPDGREVAASGVHDIRIWDTATGARRGELRGHQDTVQSVVYTQTEPVINFTNILSG